MATPIPHKLLQALIANGLCPPDALKMAIEFTPNGFGLLKYEVQIGAEHLPKLAAAFGQMDAAWRVEEGKRLADAIAAAPGGRTQPLDLTITTKPLDVHWFVVDPDNPGKCKVCGQSHDDDGEVVGEAQ